MNDTHELYSDYHLCYTITKGGTCFECWRKYTEESWQMGYLPCCIKGWVETNTDEQIIKMILIITNAQCLLALRKELSRRHNAW